VGSLFRVAVDAVEAGVELTAAEPLEVGALHIGEVWALRRMKPAQAARHLVPEGVGLSERPLVQALILFERLDVRSLGDVRLDWDHGRNKPQSPQTWQDARQCAA